MVSVIAYSTGGTPGTRAPCSKSETIRPFLPWRFRPRTAFRPHSRHIPDMSPQHPEVQRRSHQGQRLSHEYPARRPNRKSSGDLKSPKQKKGEQVYKPDSVPHRSGTAIIHLGRKLLSGSSDLPGSHLRPAEAGRVRSEPLLLPYLVLLRVGFSLPRTSPSGRCALTLSPANAGPHLFTLTPAHILPSQGGIFSVALSVPARPNLP